MVTSSGYAHTADLLVKQVSDLLGSEDPKTRIRAIRTLAQGLEMLELCVVADAQQAGLSWAQVGDVYGVSRQAVHRRFAESSHLSSDNFDELLDELASSPEAVPALERAAARIRERSGA